MDVVLGVSMETTAVRLLLIEGPGADGVTVDEENFDVFGTADSATSGAAAVAIAAIIGTREGAAEAGYQLTSTGVTWTDPGQVAALRDQLGDVGSVMLVSPLLAAAALAQTVGCALGYEHIAMLFVETGSATLAVIDVADGSIVDLHRQPLGGGQRSVTAQLATMLAGLDAPASRADGLFLIGCGVDIVGIKPALEAATSLVLSVPEEPDMALARGAALASANAPLFASSTAALAYALDPGTGEVNHRALGPTYLDVCANAAPSVGALAYSALDDEDDEDAATQRKPLVVASRVVATITAAAAVGMLAVSLTSDVGPTSAQAGHRESVLTPATQAPQQVELLPAVGAPAAAPTVEVAAPPPVAQQQPPPVVQQQPPPVVQQQPPRTVTRPPQYVAPAPQPPRAPIQQTPAPEQQAPQPSAPPAAVPAPPSPAPAPPTPIMTMYLHLPFVSIPIPINAPAPPPPPEP